MIRLTYDVIDPAEAVRAVSGPGNGGVVTFLGAVRDQSEGKTVDYLQYDAYEPMAVRQLQQVREEAMRRWPLGEVAIVHRLGRLDVGDVAVVVAVAAAHRAEAFDACRHLIDHIKDVVPIWKKEVWQDGTSAWSHPNSGAPARGEREAGEPGM